ncbi:uncharacterized protein RCO7_02338 [Rhynchosporium graminicola]|uniref:Transmembrane protein 135 N-terminal domain-containing protein n=1 Tax=Rhynchosporium graminicola TaxID=2792576 RepID=A0A1E1JVU6_9HELO|nr:uncharacterized protein RCO7_02338 [Rhynchosporium commune]
MSSPDHKSNSKSNPRISAKSTADPILRNALRYTISAKEYETLHSYILSRSKLLKRNTPSVSRVDKLVQRPGSDDYNAAAVRASLRVFVATSAGLKVWGLIKERFLGARGVNKKVPPWRNHNFRLSLSLSTILLLHRILFRFFTRLRAHLLAPEARPFRQRNKRTSKTLTSSLAPAVGASLAGFALAINPADQLRVTISIYALSRAAEFAYNLAEEEGWIWSKGEKPWWWGSWLLFPFTSGHLLYAFVFDRDCFPSAYGDFILKYSPTYVQPRPEDYPANLPWPSSYDQVDSLAEIARLRYPKFVSPILFPNSNTLPPTLSSISPITSPAHPLITSLSCAVLHPSDPSCTRTYLSHYLTTIPPLARFFTLVFSVLSLPSYNKLYNAPLKTINNLAARILRYTLFTSSSIGTSWAAICLFQKYLPSHLLSTKRFFLGGFLGGIWGYIVRREARGEFLYATRASIDSLWKVGRKRGWWKGIRGGDVWIFVVSLMCVNVVFEREKKAINSGVVRRGVGFLRGEGLKDELREEEKRLKGQEGEKRL